MADIFTKKKRSEIMSKIRGMNTSPEILVRKFLFANGYRFRIHDKRLPGSPDISLPSYQLVIMVHGCFWHGHKRCGQFRLPKTRVSFWQAKIEKNRKRDESVKRKLKYEGWRVIIAWECQLKPAKLEKLWKKLLLWWIKNKPVNFNP